MKAFFEEYGLSMLAAIAILVLIVIISPLGSVISTSLGGSTNNLKAVGDDAKAEAENALADINGLDIEEELVWNDIENNIGLYLGSTGEELTGTYAIKGKNVEVVRVDYVTLNNSIGGVKVEYNADKEIEDITANGITVGSHPNTLTDSLINNSSGHSYGYVALKLGYIMPPNNLDYITYDHITLNYENDVCFEYKDGTKEHVYLRIDHLK